jgi:hypothetical protein
METGEWTKELEQAQDLPSVISAVRLARSRNLREVELLLRFENGTYNLKLDL